MRSVQIEAGVGVAVQEHTPPKLSDEGARLLADVLERRNTRPHVSTASGRSRHDTPTARANVRRRARIPQRPAHPGNTIDLGGDDPKAPNVTSSGPSPDSWSDPFPVLVAGIVLGVLLIGFTMVLAPRGQNPPEVEVAGAVEELSSTRSSATQAPVIDPTAIDATISEVGLPINGVRSFTLDLKSVATQDEISTDAFSVVVEERDGTMLTTFVQFERTWLAVGSSASATVRAEGATPADLDAVVRLGQVEVARIPLA